MAVGLNGVRIEIFSQVGHRRASMGLYFCVNMCAVRFCTKYFFIYTFHIMSIYIILQAEISRL